MKKTKKTISAGIVLAALVVSACGNQNKSAVIPDTNAVEKVLQQNVEQELNTQNNGVSVEREDADSENGQKSSVELYNRDGVLDMTEMGGDMIYATVYQLMVDPEPYIGKTIRVKGNYHAVWYGPTSSYYHYVLIKDAMQCCAQGLEFIWGDGSHLYPDEYPQDNEEVIITGTFETYQESGDSNLYCRLANAEIEK